jgi:hypothetical protein
MDGTLEWLGWVLVAGVIGEVGLRLLEIML